MKEGSHACGTDPPLNTQDFKAPGNCPGGRQWHISHMIAGRISAIRLHLKEAPGDCLVSPGICPMSLFLC